MTRKLRMLAALSALALGLPALASDVKKEPSTTAKKTAPAKKPVFESSATIIATATIDSVDQKARTVTFHTPEGGLETVEVGSHVKNLKQVKPGDVLDITYHVYTKLQVYPASAVVPASDVEAAAAGAKEGEKPAGAAGARVTLSGTIEKLDKKTGKVTIKGDGGESRVLTARNKANLKNVEVGDKVVLTHEKAVAASVRTPK